MINETKMPQPFYWIPVYLSFIPIHCSYTNCIFKSWIFCNRFDQHCYASGMIYTRSGSDQSCRFHLSNQCCGSMTFWCGSGSGSADPCQWLMDSDPDPDPAIFVIDLQDANKKLSFLKKISTYYFLKVHLHHFLKIKVKKSHNSRNQSFSYYFCMMIEGSGAGSESGSGSIPLTNRSGSGRPKNMWIRIRNIVSN